MARLYCSGVPGNLSIPLLSRSARGQDVIHLQSALAAAGCFAGNIDGGFGRATEAGLREFQAAHGLPVTGTLTEETANVLGWSRWTPPACRVPYLALEHVGRLLPQAPKQNIADNLPSVLNALTEAGLSSPDMILMALATIRVETCLFLPVSEMTSPFNTTPAGKPFDRYDRRAELGNRGAPDGSLFRGRGFIQLTGRANYEEIGQKIGVNLVENPFLAHRADLAAKILGAFLKHRADRIQEAIAKGRLDMARKLVNGGSNGLAEFTAAFQLGRQLLSNDVTLAA